ncbi:MAG: hypothetical protein IJO00_00620 [Clostridia bacterium]|nr:hypothetical protein [Clostridia bacterium]
MEEQGRGYITVSVRTAGGAIPVEGASITIKSSNGRESKIVAVMITDSGGTSDIIALPAPPKENSLSPGKEPVCSYYTIDTDRVGFYSVINSNVPIFDGITSVQEVLLIPIAGGNGVPVPNELTRFNDSSKSNDL